MAKIPEQSAPGAAPDFPPQGFVPGPSKIAGIEVYLPAGKPQAPEVIDFKCPKCGATLAYSVETGQLTCAYCGYSEAPEEKNLGRTAKGFEFQVETLERSEKGWGDTRKEQVCQDCGGVISTPPDALAFTCPFCGSNKVLFREPLEDVLRPRYLIPFKIDPPACQAITRQWLGKSWMVSSELRKIAQEGQALSDKFIPIYIPYWTFSAACHAVWKAQVAHETIERHFINGEMKEYRKIVWRDESGKVQKAFSDLLVPGTTRFNTGALGKIDAYKIEDLTLYSPGLLAGMQAQAYDLPLEKAWDIGRQVMRERIRQACLDRVSSSNMRNFTMTLDFSDEEWRYILVPIYTSVYHYNGKAFQILLNGQTGQITGPRPVDWDRVWLVIAAMLAPGLLLSLVGWLFSEPQTHNYVTGVGVFLIIIAFLIGFFIYRKALDIEHV